MKGCTRRSGLAVIVATSALLAAPRSSMAQGSVPAEFLGRWRGLVVQPDGESFDANVLIEGGKIGGSVGTVDYPDYNCGGQLFLVENRGWQVVVREQLTYGTQSCIDDGRIVFSKPDETPAIMFEWTGSGTEATGVLQLQTR